MLILGLAVPVTASFIIAAAVVAPALIALGVEDFAAYMFIFYYAVLSEVSPPTALSPFAAAAITGGNSFKTMMLTCRYTLPAFLVPFAFVLSPKGEGLLLQGGLETVAFAVVVSIIAVIALGLALEGWLKGEISLPARLVIGVAALLLLWLEPTVTLIGLAVLAAGLGLHFAHAETAARRGLSRTAPASRDDARGRRPRPAGTRRRRPPCRPARRC